VSIKVTLSGMTIDVNFVQSRNAELPILVIVLGIVTDVKFEQNWNALAILVTVYTCELYVTVDGIIIEPLTFALAVTVTVAVNPVV